MTAINWPLDNREPMSVFYRRAMGRPPVPDAAERAAQARWMRKAALARRARQLEAEIREPRERPARRDALIRKYREMEADPAHQAIRAAGQQQVSERDAWLAGIRRGAGRGPGRGGAGEAGPAGRVRLGRGCPVSTPFVPEGQRPAPRVVRAAPDATKRRGAGTEQAIRRYYAERREGLEVIDRIRRGSGRSGRRGSHPARGSEEEQREVERLAAEAAGRGTGRGGEIRRWAALGTPLTAEECSYVHPHSGPC